MKINENPDQALEILRNYLSSEEISLAIRQLRQIYPNLDYRERVKIFIESQYEEMQDFNLNAITLNLPAFFMIGSHFSFMMNLMYYKPINTSDYIENDWKFFWSTGISYSFNL